MQFTVFMEEFIFSNTKVRGNEITDADVVGVRCPLFEVVLHARLSRGKERV